MKKVTEQEMENLINQLWLEFLSQATPLEIHQSVFTANWDGNRFLLNWIKDNPEVDKATILIAYWKSAPRWNKQYANREEVLEQAGWNINSYDFTEEVEKNIQPVTGRTATFGSTRPTTTMAKTGPTNKWMQRKCAR
ncbi:MAG TPA: DUF4274 domain-containing protein [Niastella sp.]